MTEQEGYRYEYRELHFPVWVVYNDAGEFEAAFASESIASEYVRNHK